MSCAGATGFPLSRLTFEVTETAIMSDPGRAKAALSAFHDAGIHLAMDDFGVGQSSLTYLKDLPITKMKIMLTLKFRSRNSFGLTKDFSAVSVCTINR